MHRIKELIKEKGYTQAEFAEKLNISRVGLSQLVNGKPSYPSLEKIAEALGVPMWQLFVSPEEVHQQPPKANEEAVITCPSCGERIAVHLQTGL